LIRRFALSSDNLPITTSYSIDIETGVTRYFLDTGMRVNWAIITQSNVIAAGANLFSGPYSWEADGSTTYDISAKIGETVSYVEDSLMLFYNGQLLSQGDEYEETNAGDLFDGHSFKFKAAFTPLPIAGETLQVTFRDTIDAVSLIGDEIVSINSDDIYPEVSSGMYVNLVGFTTGVTINLIIVFG
jgi:hypothetical protein